MKTIFNIVLLFSIITLLIYGYTYNLYGLEGSKDLLVSFLDIPSREISFFKEFYYYIGLSLGGFFFIFSLMMTGKLDPGYLFLLGSFIFGGVAYSIEMMRIPFIFPTIIFFLVFWFVSIFPKIKNHNNKKLMAHGIQVVGNFINTVTDYSIKINGRPGQKALIEVINPHTLKKEILESHRSFDPYFGINIPQKIDVYFDRHDEKKYFCNVAKITK